MLDLNFNFPMSISPLTEQDTLVVVLENYRSTGGSVSSSKVKIKKQIERNGANQALKENA
jgi:hypothetical protein